MRVIILSIGVKDGSAFARSFHLARGLVKLGHSVTLLVSSMRLRAEDEIRDGVRIVSFFDFLPSYVRRGGASPIELVQRILFLLRHDFDLVFTDCGFRPTTGIPGFIYAKFKRVPYVCEWWDWIGRGGIYEKKSKRYQLTLGVLDNFFESFEKKHADGVVALSQCLRERAIKLGVPRDRTCVIHGGADINIDHVPDKMLARAQLGIPMQAKVIGFAGMDGQEVEDLRPFLEAMPELRKRYPELIWFSTGGRLRNDFRELYGVGDEYREFGWVDYPTYQACLSAADVVLLIQENTLINRARWPNKLGDYLASGSVLLATDIGEVSYFAKEHTPNGIRFVAWNKDSVMGAIEEIFSFPVEAEEQAMLNKGIAIIAFSWEIKAGELSKFMECIQSIGQR